MPLVLSTCVRGRFGIGIRAVVLLVLTACETVQAISSDPQRAAAPYGQVRRVRTRQATPLWTLDEQRGTLVEMRSVGSDDAGSAQTTFDAFAETIFPDGSRYYLVSETRIELVHSTHVDEIARAAEVPSPLLLVDEESQSCPDYSFSKLRPSLLRQAHNQQRRVVFRSSHFALLWNANQFAITSEHCLDPLREIGPDTSDTEPLALKGLTSLATKGVQAKRAFQVADPCAQGQCRYTLHNRLDPIQFGWDYEGKLVQPLTGNRIVNYYRPRTIDANQWLRMSIEARFWILADELKRVGSIGLTFQERNEEPPKDTEFVKIKQEELDSQLRESAVVAPAFFSDVLQAEGITTWEVEANRPVHSVAELANDVKALSDLGLYISEGLTGFHMHVSFPSYGVRDDGKRVRIPGAVAEQYAGLWMFLNELGMLLTYQELASGSAEQNLEWHSKQWFRPVTDDNFAAVVKFLKYPDKVKREFDERWVGFRTRAKYNAGGERLGFEVRFGFATADVPAVSNQLYMVALIVDTLEKPDASAFPAAAYARSRFLSRQDLGKLSPVAKKAIRKAWEAIDPQYFVENMDLVWAIPMADWHTRLAQPADLRDRLFSKRERYSEQLDAIAQGYEDKDAHTLALEFSGALAAWLKEMRLYEYLYEYLYSL